MIPLQSLFRNAYRKNRKFDGGALQVTDLAGEEIQAILDHNAPIKVLPLLREARPGDKTKILSPG